MSVLKTHGEKIVLAVVLLVCGAFAYREWSNAESDPAEFADLARYSQAIQNATKGDSVADKYPYSASGAANLKYAEAQKANIERATKELGPALATNIVYPRPGRPLVDESTKPTDPNALTQNDYAEVLPLSDVKADADHGRVFIAFRLPQKMKYMDPVRVEVFRGPSADKIDTAKPYNTVEFGPEELASAEPAAAAAGGATADTAAAEGSALSVGEKRRSERAGTAEKETPRAATGRKEKEEVPADYADVKVFSDTRVEPKQTYFYQVRLVTRMNVLAGKRIEQKDPQDAAKMLKVLIVQPPKNAKSVLPSVPGSKALLYTTGLTEAVSATPPANFEVRLSGTSGTIDPRGTPEFKKSKDYKGTFALRVWVTEAQDWMPKTIEVSPGERLKGAIMYKDADTKQNKTYQFDAGYELKEIRIGEILQEKEVEENILDEKTGEPIVVEGRVQKRKVIKKGSPIDNEEAVLVNLADKKEEVFPKRADFGIRKKSLAYYEQLANQQAKEQKVFKEKMKKVAQRIKADDEKRKQEAEKRAAEEQQAQPGVGPTP
ncbi:MAG: hypothetical protein NTW87_27390 [Planctomycetota bacterium]|nr:hypothetical protein [Planctomycetota bacterium]